MIIVHLSVIEMSMLTLHLSTDIELTQCLAVVNLFQLCKENVTDNHRYTFALYTQASVTWEIWCGELHRIKNTFGENEDSYMYLTINQAMYHHNQETGVHDQLL